MVRVANESGVEEHMCLLKVRVRFPRTRSEHGCTLVVKPNEFRLPGVLRFFWKQ